MKEPAAPQSGSIRAFVALSLPPELKARVEGFQRELRDHLGAPRSFRWSRMEQVHLTLKFLGQIHHEAVTDLEQALREAVQGCGPIELAAADLGFFPDRRRPRVCWLGILDELNALRRLQEKVDLATEAWVPREEKTFAPHLTLARIKQVDHALLDKLSTLPEEMWHVRVGAWEVKAVFFMQSELHPQGARYTELAEVPLTGIGKGH